MLFAQRADPFGPPDLIRNDFNGWVIRAFGSAVTWRKPTETFHEFCFDVLKRTFGQEWLDEQFALCPEERHVVARWLSTYSNQTRRERPESHPAGQVFSAPPTGGAQHAILFGRDLLYLQQVDRLPDALVERLRHRAEFQGAWYEVTVASALMHGGFEIEWLSKKSESHCEFTAFHPHTRERVAVEAKSKRYAGVLNEPGETPPTLRTLAHRVFRDALKKDPEGFPYVIFVDVNMPPDSSLAEASASWAGHMRDAIESHGTLSSDPATFALAVCTNFSWHQRVDETIVGPGIVYSHRPQFSSSAIQNDLTVHAIEIGLKRVGVLPSHTL